MRCRKILNFNKTKSQILIPPMKSQYTEDVFADDAHKVWHYVNNTFVQSMLLTFNFSG